MDSLPKINFSVSQSAHDLAMQWSRPEEHWVKSVCLSRAIASLGSSTLSLIDASYHLSATIALFSLVTLKVVVQKSLLHRITFLEQSISPIPANMTQVSAHAKKAAAFAKFAFVTLLYGLIKPEWSQNAREKFHLNPPKLQLFLPNPSSTIPFQDQMNACWNFANRYKTALAIGAAVIVIFGVAYACSATPATVSSLPRPPSLSQKCFNQHSLQTDQQIRADQSPIPIYSTEEDSQTSFKVNSAVQQTLNSSKESSGSRIREFVAAWTPSPSKVVAYSTVLAICAAASFYLFRKPVIFKIPGDGNCLFHSLHYGLSLRTEHLKSINQPLPTHDDLRKKAAFYANETYAQNNNPQNIFITLLIDQAIGLHNETIDAFLSDAEVTKAFLENEKRERGKQLDDDERMNLEFLAGEGNEKAKEQLKRLESEGKDIEKNSQTDQLIATLNAEKIDSARAWIQHMAQPGVFGTQVDIYAISAMYQIPIRIFSKDKQKPDIVNPSKSDAQPIDVLHINGNHFDLKVTASEYRKLPPPAV